MFRFLDQQGKNRNITRFAISPCPYNAAKLLNTVASVVSLKHIIYKISNLVSWSQSFWLSLCNCDSANSLILYLSKSQYCYRTFVSFINWEIYWKEQKLNKIIKNVLLLHSRNFVDYQPLFYVNFLKLLFQISSSTFLGKFEMVTKRFELCPFARASTIIF